MAEIVVAPVEVGSLSHYLQRFIHPRWFGISEPSTIDSLVTFHCTSWLMVGILRMAYDRSLYNWRVLHTIP